LFSGVAASPHHALRRLTAYAPPFDQKPFCASGVPTLAT
jgi:hypothetical protein